MCEGVERTEHARTHAHNLCVLCARVSRARAHALRGGKTKCFCVHFAATAKVCLCAIFCARARARTLVVRNRVHMVEILIRFVRWRVTLRLRCVQRAHTMGMGTGRNATNPHAHTRITLSNTCALTQHIRRCLVARLVRFSANISAQILRSECAARAHARTRKRCCTRVRPWRRARRTRRWEIRVEHNSGQTNRRADRNCKRSHRWRGRA